MSSVKIQSVGRRVLVTVDQDPDNPVGVLLTRERLLALADAAAHVASGIVKRAVVRLPEARWLKDGEVL